MARKDRPRAERIWPLLHRAQPWPSRSRGHAGGSRQRSHGGELLGLPPRTVIGSLLSAWSLERTRLDRTGSSAWSIHNDILQAWAMSAVLLRHPRCGLRAGRPAVHPVAGRNRHHGRSRSSTTWSTTASCGKSGEDGRYERCQPQHSWNSANLVSNVFHVSPAASQRPPRQPYAAISGALSRRTSRPSFQRATRA